MSDSARTNSTQENQNILIDFLSIDKNSIAVNYEGREITYETFFNDICNSQTYLAEIDKGNQLRVGVSLQSIYWEWVIQLAAIRQGYSVAMLRNGDDYERASQLTGINVLLTDQNRSQSAARQVINLKRLVEMRENGQKTCTSAPSNSEKKATRIIFTSGTTGSLKWIELDHETMVKRLKPYFEKLTITNETKLFCTQGTHSSGGQTYPIATWRKAGTVILSDNFNRQYIENSNILRAPTGHLSKLLEKIPGKWRGAEDRVLAVGGARLPIKLRDEALKRVCSKIIISFGATEVGPIAGYDASHLSKNPYFSGKLFDDVIAQVVDEKDNIRPNGSPGLLRLKTTYMASSYGNKNMEDLQNPFQHGFFYTGDVAIIEADRSLHILGRESQILNISGMKISAEKLEQSLEEIDGVTETCAVSIQTSEADHLGIVYVADRDIRKDEFSYTLKQHVNLQMIKILTIRVNNLPKNDAGKLLRTAISQSINRKIQSIKPSK